MTVRERLLRIRIHEQVKRDPKFAEKIGVEVYDRIIKEKEKKA